MTRIRRNSAETAVGKSYVDATYYDGETHPSLTKLCVAYALSTLQVARRFVRCESDLQSPWRMVCSSTFSLLV